MDNKTALALGVLILGFFGVDYTVFDWQLSPMIARKLADLIEEMAFWR